MIAICSAIFSAISIMVTVLSTTMEKSLINQQEFTTIRIDILSGFVAEKASYCRKSVNKIQAKISGICGLDAGLIEIVKPQTIPNGLRIECYLYVTNAESTGNKYLSAFEEAQKNGSLARCISESWKLSEVPKISNLEMVEINSADEKKRVLLLTIEMGEVDELEDNMEMRINPIYKAWLSPAVNNSMANVIEEHDDSVSAEMQKKE